MEHDIKKTQIISFNGAPGKGRELKTLKIWCEKEFGLKVPDELINDTQLYTHKEVWQVLDRLNNTPKIDVFENSHDCKICGGAKTYIVMKIYKGRDYSTDSSFMNTAYSLWSIAIHQIILSPFHVHLPLFNMMYRTEIVNTKYPVQIHASI